MTNENTNEYTDTENPTTAAKNRDLLRKLATANEALASTNERLQQLEAAEAAREEEAALKAGNYEALVKKMQTAHEKAIKDTADKLAASEARIQALISDSTISGILASHDVDPDHAEVLSIYLKSKLNIKDGVATLGDKDPAVFAKEYFSSEGGSRYLREKVNSGAGSQGNLGGVKGYAGQKFQLGTYNTLYAQNPAEAARYADETGASYMNKAS